MTTSLPVLYVKTGCPWCTQAIDFLSRIGVGFREKNVTEDESARTEMEKFSGQSKAPVLDWDGTVLADFGLDCGREPGMISCFPPLPSSNGQDARLSIGR